MADDHPLRVAPLAPEHRDERTQELLSGLADMNIFTTLAHHPRLLKRWSQFGGTLLYNGDLPARSRELLILRTAYHCYADYEWGQHVRIGKEAGLTDEEITTIATTDCPDNPLWSADDADLLRAADELHNDSHIGNATWSRLTDRLTTAQLIELCMVVGQYHLVAFTLNSLGVQREDGIEGLPA